MCLALIFVIKSCGISEDSTCRVSVMADSDRDEGKNGDKTRYEGDCSM